MRLSSFIRHLVISGLTLGLGLGTFVGGMAAQQNMHFQDVPNNHWAKDAIAFVSSLGLMKGTTPNTFEPDAPLTRAQFAMVLYRQAGGANVSAIKDNLSKARDAQRRSDVNTLLNAIYQYSIDNNGALPAAFDQSDREICNSRTTCSANVVDLSILKSAYLVAIPQDPLLSEEASNISGYTVQMDSQHRIIVKAPHAENGTVSVAR